MPRFAGEQDRRFAGGALDVSADAVKKRRGRAACVNGCGEPVCAPSRVICARCIDRVSVTLARLCGCKCPDPLAGGAERANGTRNLAHLPDCPGDR